MKKHLTLILSVFLTLSFNIDSQAQSKSFKLGQWVETQHAIIKELNMGYVDTLPIQQMMRKSIDEMLEALDPYTVYMPEEENENWQMMLSKTYGGIGAIIHKKVGANVIINEPYENSPAHKAGLRCGDEIIEIDGKPTKDLESKESSDRMKGKPGTKVVFKVKKAYTKDTVDITIVRERIHIPDIDYAGMLDDTTGYILQSGFTEGVANEVKDKVLELKKQGMKRLVFDLRSNGGGLMEEAVKIVGLFVPKGSLVVSARGKHPDSYREYKTSSDPIDLDLPIIVLINGASASSSEIVSGALQDMDRAVIKGTRSFGKGLVQSIRPLPYGAHLKITTAKYYTPSGRCVQSINYNNRDEDGGVANIPDSLTNEFKTASGRIVRDGGGITPDEIIEAPAYSRLMYSIVLSGVVDEYIMDYARNHESIAPPDEFYFNDDDFEEFINFAKTKEFDYRSKAKTHFDLMKKELEADGLTEAMKDEIAALEKAIEMDKEQVIRLKKDEIVPYIEEQIVTRYWFQQAGVKVRIRYDEQLKKAL